jgi:transcription elongation factor Elf1
MPEYQEDTSFQCPYCASMISTLVDLTAGNEQDFTIDCDVCCRPILISVTIEDGAVSDFHAVRESS